MSGRGNVSINLPSRRNYEEKKRKKRITAFKKGGCDEGNGKQQQITLPRDFHFYAM